MENSVAHQVEEVKALVKETHRDTRLDIEKVEAILLERVRRLHSTKTFILCFCILIGIHFSSSAQPRQNQQKGVPNIDPRGFVEIFELINSTKPNKKDKTYCIYNYKSADSSIYFKNKKYVDNESSTLPN